MTRLFHITAALLLVNCLLAWSCERPNPVGPTGAGGSVATGGAPAIGGQGPTAGAPGTGGAGPNIDGKALCVGATLNSPDRQREARDNGMSVNALAESLCGYQTVQDCFARGMCK